MAGKEKLNNYLAPGTVYPRLSLSRSLPSSAYHSIQRYLHVMSAGISSILCIHKSRHRSLAVLVPVLGANPSISFLCIHETDLVSFEIELT